MENMDPQKTFWGLVIEQGKQYKQTPSFNFHVSRAVLDLANYDKQPVSLRVQVDNGEFVLCNLNENETQVSLDLIFSEGEKVKFFTTGGKGNVHLTGYVMPEDSLSQFDDEEFSDEDVSEDEQVMLNHLNQAKRKNTETVKLAGKDSKKMKTDDKLVEANAKQQKVVDVDTKQLLNKKDNKQQDNQQNKKKEQQQSKNKVAMDSKLATKGLEMDSDSDVNDDDLSIDEDESVDLNAMMDEDSDLNDEDLESNDDLESDDEDDVDIAKLNKMKNQAAGKPNLQQANKSEQQQKPKNGLMVRDDVSLQNKQNQQQKPNKPFKKQNKSPQNNKFSQQMNKNQQNTPNQNKNQDKPHQQTPFHQKKGNDFKKNSNKKNQGTPFQSGNKGNKSFGSQNKQGKKFNA